MHVAMHAREVRHVGSRLVGKKLVKESVLELTLDVRVNLHKLVFSLLSPEVSIKSEIDALIEDLPLYRNAFIHQRHQGILYKIGFDVCF